MLCWPCKGRTMLNINREKGKTTIELGSMTIVSDRINRYRYNELRKQIDKLNNLIRYAIAQGKRK